MRGTGDGKRVAECRECGALLSDAVEVYSGWCRPCGVWEFRCDSPERDWIADQEDEAA